MVEDKYEGELGNSEMMKVKVKVKVNVMLTVTVYNLLQ